MMRCGFHFTKDDDGSDLEHGNLGVITVIEGKTIRGLDDVGCGPSLEVRGYATRYMKFHVGRDGIELFAPRCFERTLGSGVVKFLIAHDQSKEVANTSNGLELLEDEEGLAFRLPLPATATASQVKDLANDGRAAMSLAYRVHSEETRLVGGHKVRCILDAELVEISILPPGKGAVKQAHLILDQRSSRSLPEMCERKELLADAAATTIRRSAANFLALLDDYALRGGVSGRSA